MADRSLITLQTEITEGFLEGLTSPYELYVADSTMSGAGFGLFVGQEVPAGKEIFRAAVPAVSAVESTASTCDNCFAWVGLSDPFRTPVKLLSCVACKATKYCSKMCQRTAWRRYHKEECKIYCEINTRSMKAHELNSTTRMLIRLMVLHQHGQLPDNQWQAILALESHKTSIEQSEDLDWAAINADIRLVKEVTKIDLPETDLADLYWRIKINEHSMDSPMQPMLGSCVVPGAALINHSCYPNAHHLSEGPELVVRSCQKIAKNEEIKIAYIDHTKSFKERQEELFTAYAFICQCCRCSEGFEEHGEILTGDPTTDAPIHLARSELDDLLHGLRSDDQVLGGVEARIREICRNEGSGKPWPINTAPIPNIYVVLVQRFEEEQQWKEALYHWLRIVYVIDPLRYTDRFNPHRVEHLMLLAQLEARIETVSETDVAVKATFQGISSKFSVALYSHFFRLREDAAATLGTNHLIYRVAANYVNVRDAQMMASLKVTPSEWEKMKGPKLEECERALLKWAGIDLGMKVIE